MHCDWFILPLLLLTPTIWFSLDRKRRNHKRSQKKMEMFRFFRVRFCRAYDSAYNSDFWFSLSHKFPTTLLMTPTLTLSLVKLKPALNQVVLLPTVQGEIGIWKINKNKLKLKWRNVYFKQPLYTHTHTHYGKWDVLLRLFLFLTEIITCLHKTLCSIMQCVMYMVKAKKEHDFLWLPFFRFFWLQHI